MESSFANTIFAIFKAWLIAGSGSVKPTLLKIYLYFSIAEV